MNRFMATAGYLLKESLLLEKIIKTVSDISPGHIQELDLTSAASVNRIDDRISLHDYTSGSACGVQIVGGVGCSTGNAALAQAAR
jgi:hypothetical protein